MLRAPKDAAFWPVATISAAQRLDNYGGTRRNFLVLLIARTKEVDKVQFM